jgi:hypothetical protein
MGTTLTTAVKNIQKVANIGNRELITKTYDLMQLKGLSPVTITNHLKACVEYANFLGDAKIIDVNDSEIVFRYLNTKLKSEVLDPNRRSLRTWNDSLDKLRTLYTLIYGNILESGNRRVEELEVILPKFISAIRRKKLEPKSIYKREHMGMGRVAPSCKIRK